MIKRERVKNYYELIGFILDENTEQAFKIARGLLRDDGGKHIMGCYEDIKNKRGSK